MPPDMSHSVDFTILSDIRRLTLAYLLALQLLFCFEVRALGGGLVCSALE